MRYIVYHVMDISKTKQRLELALRPAEPPALEEVLEEVSTRGVLRGPVDRVFPAWILYVEYATQKIAETLQLTEEERSQLFGFRDTLKQLLREAWMQAKAKLTALYKTVAEGTYRLEEKRLYAPNLASYGADMPHSRHVELATYVRFRQKPERARWRRGWDVSGGSPAVEPTPPNGDGLATATLAGPRLGPTRPPRLGGATTTVLNFSLLSTYPHMGYAVS